MVGRVYTKKRSGGIDTRRITALVVVSALVVGVIAFRLFDLQVVNGEYYSSLASGQHELFEELTPTRGEILIRDGDETYPLAVNRQLYMVYAVPNIIDDPEETAKKVAEILEIPTPEERERAKKQSKAPTKENVEAGIGSEDFILNTSSEKDALTITYERLLEKLSQEEDPYEAILRRVSKEKAEAIEEAGLTGIRTAAEEWRYYPENSFAAHVLGYVGFQNEVLMGQYGVEGYYNDVLEGEPGYFQGEKDTEGRWISIGAKEIKHAEDGSDLVLTLDRTIQYGAEKYAKQAHDKYAAQETSIIVLQPDTGKILGMANYPTYNLNEYNKVEDINSFNNSAILDLYEPGSIFKPLVMAAAINEGLVGPYTTFNNTNTVKVDSFTIGNAVQAPRGETTMTETLGQSLNTGMVFVTDKLGNEKLYHYLEEFGLNELTGVGLETEGSTLLASSETWSNSKRATIGFGQGIASTALHIAAANASLANGGKLMQPQIIDEIRHPDGTTEEVEPKEIRQVLSPETARTVSAMLVEGVENGVAGPAAVDGYRIAGKTGTAQVAVNGSYDNSQKITSFVGYGPVEDPQVLILVKIINPENGKWGSTTAAPIFSQYAADIFEYLKIPPTKE